MGKVRVSYSVYKGEGEQVLYAEHLMTALYRDPARFADDADAQAAKAKARQWLNSLGMTWDHARGFDPMVATSEAWAQGPSRRDDHMGEAVASGLRRPADREMADTYDLMVIDHPHVGEVSRSGNSAGASTASGATTIWPRSPRSRWGCRIRPTSSMAGNGRWPSTRRRPWPPSAPTCSAAAPARLARGDGTCARAGRWPSR
jgi:hypothetical protein